MDIEKIKELVAILKEKDNFLVATHVGYDPDALSSLIAMGLILEKLRKNFALYLDDDLKEEFSWVPLKEKIIAEVKENYENVIIVDCDSYLRTSEKIHKTIQNKFKILIDNHRTNKFDADANYIFPEVVATAEIFFYLARELDVKTSKMADILLLGILGDTLGLTIEFERETLIRVLDVIKEILTWGADWVFINRILYLRSWNEVKKLSEIILKTNRDGDIFWVQINNMPGVPTSIFANNLNRIKEAKVIIVFVKNDKGLRLHFRSKGDIDVGQLAKMYFNGGGHKNASGGFLVMDFENGVKYTLEKVKEFLDVNKKF